MTRNRPRNSAYTLMEMLVAMTLLIVLGGGLVTILRQSVSIWSTAESRGRMYERARVLLDLISADLESTAIRSHREGADSWIRFISDWYDQPGARGSQRLRFVRTISGEMADPVLRSGGRRLATTSRVHYDGKSLPDVVESGRLAASGGLMEVFYMHDPRPEASTVWRGVRAPVGGPGSLFVNGNVEPAATSGLGPKSSLDSAPDDEESLFLEEFASPVADQILYLGFRFWTGTTNTWGDVPPLAKVGPGESSGPSWMWDSTRALLTEQVTEREAGTFRWRPRSGSLHDALDDVFPEFVEVTVVIAREEELLGSRLTEELAATGTTLAVSRELPPADDSSERMVLVDGEWIAVESASGRYLTVAENGRARRGTRAAKHDRGARVVTGVTFRRVIAIPSFRSDPGRPSGSRKSLRSSR